MSAVLFYRQGDANDTGSVDLADASGAYAIPVGSTLTVECAEQAALALAARRVPATFTAASASIDGTRTNRCNFVLSAANLLSPATTYDLVVHVLLPDAVTRWTWPSVGSVPLTIRTATGP